MSTNLRSTCTVTTTAVRQLVTCAMIQPDIRQPCPTPLEALVTRA
jgi:hypothetical protein